jgi:hypothetical protein
MSVFGWPETSEQDSQQIGYIEDDMELNIYRVVGGVESWEKLGEKIRARVFALLGAPAAVRYRVLFDDSRFVPENKKVEQQMRTRAASASTGRAPFSPEEQRGIRVGETPIPVASAVFFQRLMATRELRPQLRAFLTAELAKMRIPPNKCLVIDGGVPTRLVAESERQGSTLRIVNASDFAGGDITLGERTAAEVAASSSMIGLTTPTTSAIKYDAYGHLDGSDCILDSAGGYDIGTSSASAAAAVDTVIVPSYDTATTITVTPRTDGVAGNDVHIATAPCIAGEGDFKIPAGIASAPRGAHVFVRSCDTDMLLILLVNMRRWIDREEDGGGPRYTIHIDTNGAVQNAANERPILNITKLWAVIVQRFLTDFPWVCYPVETLATLMLLTGSDYLKAVYTDPVTKETKMAMGLPQLGPVSVWKAFCNPAARAILFPRNTNNGASGGWGRNCGTELAPPPVIVERVHADTVQPIRIGIDESRWLNFIAFMYHHKIFGAYPSPHAFFSDARGYDFAALRKMRQRAFDEAAAKQSDPARISAAARWFPPTPEALFVFVRQMSWHLHYLANGASSEPFRDPFEITPIGRSVYGWVMSNDRKSVYITMDVHGSTYTE